MEALVVQPAPCSIVVQQAPETRWPPCSGRWRSRRPCRRRSPTSAATPARSAARSLRPFPTSPAGTRAGTRQRAGRRGLHRRHPAVHLPHDRRPAGRAGRGRGEVEPRRGAAAGARAALAAHGRQGARHRHHRADPVWCSSSGRVRAPAAVLGLVDGARSTSASPRCALIVWFVVGFAMLRAGARRARRAGLPAGGRRLVTAPVMTVMMVPVHHRRQHRAVGPDQPARRRPVVRPVLAPRCSCRSGSRSARSAAWEVAALARPVARADPGAGLARGPHLLQRRPAQRGRVKLRDALSAR